MEDPGEAFSPAPEVEYHSPEPAPVLPMPRGMPVPDPRGEAQSRAEACGRELQALLARHRCRLVPTMALEPVGSDGSRALLQVGFAVGTLP
ncbi:MAG TPA: hypothetical protein VNM34_15025 [Verrucomicrobiae bacterium]|nr:hypothetical protein [Verrucomicrobiae bacterium]